MLTPGRGRPDRAPLFGKKTDGWLGYIIDIITVVATVIGVATTLGFGAIQINGGLGG